MNENENEVVVDDDNYDVDLSEFEGLTDDAADGNQTEAEEPDEASQEQENTEQEEEHEDGAPTDEQDGAGEELFDLKYNKETKPYTREQVTELAQKGLNYDHVTEQRDRLQQENAELSKYRDENAPVVEALKAAAEAAGKDLPEFLTVIRANMLVSQGLSPEVAHERILREDAERRLQATTAEKARKSETEARQREDIRRFQEKFKEVDPKTIPQEVWSAVGRGELLVDAYGDYQRRELERQLREANEKLAIRAKNESNKQKTLGSLHSKKQEIGKDPFLEGFYSDD